MAHVFKIIQGLQDRTLLENAGCCATKAGLTLMLAAEIGVEDDLARLYGTYAMVLSGLRQKRGLWLPSSWPVQMTAILDGGSRAEQTLELFQKDLHMFRALRDSNNLGARAKRLLARHVMQTTSVRQFAMAFEDPEINSSAHADCVSLVRSRVRGILATQVVEDCFAIGKNSRSQLSGRRFRKPEAIMATLLGSKVLKQRHHYDTVQAERMLAAKSQRLPLSAFRQTKANRSIPFEDIVSASSTTSWWSTTGNNSTVNVPDLQLLRFISPDFDKAENCWLGELIDSKHSVVFQRDGVKR